MKINKKEIIKHSCLISIPIIYTILVKFIDVQAIGSAKSLVGFSTINEYIFNFTGVNMLWYYITEYLGLIPLMIAIIYSIIGLIQMIKRESIFKVEKEILVLGIFYIIIFILYTFFEIFIINYRPILIDGIKEASYPSSHTLLSICICGSSLMINKYLFKKNLFFKVENVISILSILIIVIGRIISGVHWITDIIGSILISIVLLKILDICFKSIKK